MLLLRASLGIIALAAPAMAARADDLTTNATSVLDYVPECAYPCLISKLQSANCLSSSKGFLADCLCTNINLQSDISTCVQLSCDLLSDQKDAFAVENQLCEAFPKESRASVSIITAIVTIAVSIPIVGLRCATRIKMTKRLWMDDYMSLLSLAALLTIASIQIYSVSIGSGMHYWNTDVDKFPMTRQLFYAAKILYVFVQCTGKIAILLLYLRVFDTGSGARWFIRAIKVMLVLTLAIEGGYIFIVAFQCLPVASLWDPSITEAKCLNANIAFTAGAVLNIASDLVLMILPIPALWKLQTTKRKRAGVALMLAIASLGIIASLVRIKFLTAGSSAFDSSYYNVDVYAWSLIELLCVVVCGSVPALRPLLVHTISAIRTTVSGSWQRSRGSRGSRPTQASRKSELMSASRYSAVALKQHAKSDSYSLSHLSTTNSTGPSPTRYWKDVPASPLERSPVVLVSRSSDPADTERRKGQALTETRSRLSPSGSEEDLIGTVPTRK